MVFGIKGSFLSYKRGTIVESAPLIKTLTVPSQCLTITDIRFQVLVNSITFNNSYFSKTGGSKAFKQLFTSTSMLLLESRPINLYPKYLAALTSANSSGELAL